MLGSSERERGVELAVSQVPPCLENYVKSMGLFWASFTSVAAEKKGVLSKGSKPPPLIEAQSLSPMHIRKPKDGSGNPSSPSFEAG